MIITTQSEFSIMKGHVAHCTLVRCDCGESLAILSTMRGWSVVDSNKKEVCSASSAIEVAAFIEVYGR